MKKLASILLYGLILVSCKKPAGIEFRGIQNFKLIDLEGDSATVKTDLKFFNPNHYPIEMKKLEADVFANQVLVTHYILDTFISIPADTTFLFNTKLKFNQIVIFNNMLDALFKKEILFEVKGKTKVGRGGFFMQVPFSVSTKQQIKF